MAITPGGRVGDASSLAKPGYKGKRKLDDYVRMVAHALLRKHPEWDKGHAIAVAKNSLKKWSRGGGKVRPQVRAGAASHLAVQKGIDKSLSEPGNLPGMGRDIKLALALAAAEQRGITLDLVGPKGYVHGWRYVGGPGLPSKATKGGSRKGRVGRRSKPAETDSQMDTNRLSETRYMGRSSNTAKTRTRTTPTGSRKKAVKSTPRNRSFQSDDSLAHKKVLSDKTALRKQREAEDRAKRQGGDKPDYTKMGSTELLSEKEKKGADTDAINAELSRRRGRTAPAGTAWNKSGGVNSKDDVQAMSDEDLLKAYRGPDTALSKKAAAERGRRADAAVAKGQAEAAAPKGSGTKLTKHESVLADHDVSIDGVHAGRIKKATGSTPVTNGRVNIATGSVKNKGYRAQVPREGGGHKEIGTHRTRAEAIRAIEEHHKRNNAPKQDAIPGSGKAEADGVRINAAKKDILAANAVLGNPRASSTDRARARKLLERAKSRLSGLEGK